MDFKSTRYETLKLKAFDESLLNRCYINKDYNYNMGCAVANMYCCSYVMCFTCVVVHMICGSYVLWFICAVVQHVVVHMCHGSYVLWFV